MNKIIRHTLYIIVLAITMSCTVHKQAANEQETESQVQLCGGYTQFRPLQDDEATLFRETYKGDMTLEPFEVATQVVAGTNYKFRCTSRNDKSIYQVTIYQPLPGQGAPEVTSTTKETTE